MSDLDGLNVSGLTTPDEIAALERRVCDLLSVPDPDMGRVMQAVSARNARVAQLDRLQEDAKKRFWQAYRARSSEKKNPPESSRRNGHQRGEP